MRAVLEFTGRYGHPKYCNCAACRRKLSADNGYFNPEDQELGSFNTFGEKGQGRITVKKDPNPVDLAIINGIGNKKVPVHRIAKVAWEKMIAAARADGLTAPLLLPSSGYRSYAHQQRLWEAGKIKHGSAAEARKWVAPPGHSAHQSGRAFDLYLGVPFGKKYVSQQKNTKAYQWMIRNAHRFGFYPYDREPWHWEFNPTPQQEQFILRGKISLNVPSKNPSSNPSGTSTMISKGKLVDIVRNWGSKETISKALESLIYNELPHIQKKPYNAMSAQEKRDFQKKWIELRTNLLDGRKALLSRGFIPPLGKDKIPFGFKVPASGRFKGKGLAIDTNLLKRPRLDVTLVKLFKQGLVNITQDELDIFQRIANVETSGTIHTLNTYDSGVVSIGFMQFTLHVGKIQQWIKLAEPTFKRYGIELDASFKYNFGKNGTYPAIKGVNQRNINELRWNGWAERFYYAGFDKEIIVAQVKLAKEYLQKHLRGLKNRLKNDQFYNTFIKNYYNNDAYIRGLFQESYNNNPSRATLCIKETMNTIGIHASLDVFLKSYKEVMIKKDWKRLVEATANGTNLKL